jgi:hypothetical protein
MTRVLFGGLDIAQRTDNASFLMLERHEDGVFEEVGLKVWPHINFDKVGDDIGKIWMAERMHSIGYDRLGIGETAEKILPPYLPLHAIVSSQPAKHRMINMVAGMIQSHKLIIHTQILYEEILAQQKKISDAGNVLYYHLNGQHDDRFWSLCYACEMASTAIGGVLNHTGGFTASRTVDIDTLLKQDIQKGLDSI